MEARTLLAQCSDKLAEPSEVLASNAPCLSRARAHAVMTPLMIDFMTDTENIHTYQTLMLGREHDTIHDRPHTKRLLRL